MQDLDRAWAVRMCALIGTSGRGAERSLERALADESPFLRGEAARALAQTQADAAITVPLIARALCDSNAGVRSQAAIALGVYRQSALPVLENLRDAQERPRPDGAVFRAACRRDDQDARPSKFANERQRASELPADTNEGIANSLNRTRASHVSWRRPARSSGPTPLPYQRVEPRTETRLPVHKACHARGAFWVRVWP